VVILEELNEFIFSALQPVDYDRQARVNAKFKYITVDYTNSERKL